jgi:L-rhamnose isomerase
MIMRRPQATAAANDPTRPPTPRQTAAAYAAAKELYAAIGVDSDRAIAAALAVPISVHCWQADDGRGLERGHPPSGSGALDSGGIQATGDYSGAARSGDEIRQDFDQAMKWMPGRLRFNLHAMYAETDGKRVDRDELEPAHFARWVDWAKGRRPATSSGAALGLDFNPTLFAHPMVKDGLTLSSDSRSVRAFWIRHCQACRNIARAIARQLGPCVTNIWIPDGRKDSAADRWGPRRRLAAALDQILARRLPGVLDAVEGKLFGIGTEDYTVGSHEFYLGYAVSRGVMLCFDMGHFHPTESAADKLSAALLFLDRLLLHVSRGVRWDSDHVVLASDETQALCDEAARGRALDRIHWALDYFDASINRVGAWVIGLRALRKALLRALLEPWPPERRAEYEGRGADKLALLERRAEMPWGAVWDYACLSADVPVGAGWLRDLAQYERRVQSRR